MTDGLDDDPARPKKIRYIFTVVMPQMEMMTDPLVQRNWVADQIAKFTETCKPERVGVVAVMENDDGKLDGR